jgi:hypothetical protein
MVKVDPFLRSPVKVEFGKNSVSTFPNGFLDLSQLLPTFSHVGKVRQTTTFQLFPPIYRGKVKKSMDTRGKSDSPKIPQSHKHDQRGNNHKPAVNEPNLKRRGLRMDLLNGKRGLHETIEVG